MALNIKDEATEQLAAEVALLAHENKTVAVRVALQERKDRLEAAARRTRRAERMVRFLEHEAWPQIPAELLGHEMPKSEREAVLGYGPEGV